MNVFSADTLSWRVDKSHLREALSKLLTHRICDNNKHLLFYASKFEVDYRQQNSWNTQKTFYFLQVSI